MNQLPKKSKADTILTAQTTVNTLRFGEWILDAHLGRNNIPDIFQVFTVFPITLKMCIYDCFSWNSVTDFYAHIYYSSSWMTLTSRRQLRICWMTLMMRWENFVLPVVCIVTYCFLLHIFFVLVDVVVSAKSAHQWICQLVFMNVPSEGITYAFVYCIKHWVCWLKNEQKQT